MFEGEPRWNGAIPGDLGGRVCTALNDAIQLKDGGYYYQGIEDIGRALESNPVVRSFLMSDKEKAAAQ